MKKIFTLLAFVLMAGYAFGQKNWTNLVVNGDMEGTVPSYESPDQLSGDWNSFWVHTWPETASDQYRGTADIVEDPLNPGNHCAKVVIRSDEEAVAAGNRVEANGALASWDCQFFIYATDPIPVGKEIRLTMKVRAEKAGSLETQAHWSPGDYNHYQLFGNISYTEEWTTVKVEADVIADHVKESDGKAFQSVAFNLSTMKDGNVIYFDDIKLQVRDPQTDDGTDPGAWINFMRKGIYSMDNITGTRNDGSTFYCTNYTFQDLNQPEGQQQQPAPVVEVPGEPGVMAVHIPVPGYVIQEVEDLDADGNQQIDDDGNVKMKTVYYWNDGREIGTSAPARWTCQFFVSTLHKMVKGEKYRFKFKAKADKPTKLGTQAHTGPGDYVSYNTFGDENAFPIGTDWTTFELGDFDSVEDASKHVIPSGANGCQTITFDCVPLEGDDNNFYLIVDEFSFTEKYVTVADRTLGSHEAIALQVNTDEDEKANTIDGTGMLNTFEVADFSFLNNGKDGIKFPIIIEPDDPEEPPIDSFGSLLTWSDGGFVGANGLYIEEDTGVNLRFDEESVDGNNVNIMVWNSPTSGLKFAAGETLETQLAVSQSGWYYIYDVTLMGPEDYEAYQAELAGINNVVVNKKNNGIIYDLMGRKVTNPTKGIYIKDGKKFIQK
ncbi:MAG: hypothetical protein IKW98_01275 [Prevotella sp.]|nr:hypothetical protein [Prevotella sp.]